MADDAYASTEHARMESEPNGASGGHEGRLRRLEREWFGEGEYDGGKHGVKTLTAEVRRLQSTLTEWKWLARLAAASIAVSAIAIVAGAVQSFLWGG